MFFLKDVRIQPGKYLLLLKSKFCSPSKPKDPNTKVTMPSAGQEQNSTLQTIRKVEKSFLGRNKTTNYQNSK